MKQSFCHHSDTRRNSVSSKKSYGDWNNQRLNNQTKASIFGWLARRERKGPTKRSNNTVTSIMVSWWSKPTTIALFVASFTVVSLFLMYHVTAVSCSRTLRFQSNGKFKIVQFTDMHFGENGQNDEKTMKQQAQILKWEQPDFVVISGDSISGHHYSQKVGCMKDGVAGCYPLTVRAMMDANITWAYILGNHDGEGNLSREQVMKLDLGYPLSMSQMGPNSISGHSNYVLQVLGSNSDKAVSHLYFMDTGNRECMGVPGWSCMMPDQVEWYRTTSMELRRKHGAILPSLAFFHIASQEYMTSLNNLQGRGTKKETVCCSSVNTGILGAFKEMQDVKATYVGHDHNNDYIVDYNGVTLNYGRKTGFGGYFGKHFKRGARVIQITESPFKIDTWVRQEDGTIDRQTDTLTTSKSPQLKCGGANS